MPSERIVIVGAGPCGLLLAMTLLQRSRRTSEGGRGEQYRVTVVERRPDPRSVAQSSRRTYPISLQSRGLNAIRTIPGLIDLMEKAGGLWSVGSAMHSRRGKARLRDQKEAMLMMDRSSIVSSMLDHLEKSDRESGDGEFEFSVHFECSFGRFEECGGEKAIRVNTAAGGGESSFSVPYDRLVAADGSGSAVRAALVGGGKMKCEESYVPDSYRSLYVPMAESPSGPDGMKESHHLASDRLHSFLMSNGVRMMLVPNHDRYLHGTIIFAPDKDPIAECDDGDAVMDYFLTECPRTVGKLITLEEAEALRNRSASRILTVRCDRMAIGSDVVLLGDAAHAVSPSIGQGCNSSLQDVVELGRALDESKGDWDGAIPAFAERRLPEAHAVKDLSDYSIPRTRLMWMEFIFRLTIGKWIRRWFPSLLAPMPFEVLLEGDMPYTEALNLTKGWVNRVKQSMLKD